MKDVSCSWGLLTVGACVLFILSFCPAAYTWVAFVVGLIASALMVYAENTSSSIRWIIVAFVVAGIVTSSYVGSGIRYQEKHQENVERLVAKYQQDYDAAIDILKKTSSDEDAYKKASDLLMRFSIDSHDDEDIADATAQFPDGKVLYLYAEAMATYNGGKYHTVEMQYGAALDLFKKIPPDYDGDLADQIAYDRLKVQRDYQKAKDLLKAVRHDSAAERAANIEVGESESKITKVLGQPETINVTKVKNGEHKQYVYSGERYVYTMNGVITGMQNIEHRY